jgi:hypothetical protein
MGRPGFKCQFALLAANARSSASSMFVLGLVAVERATPERARPSSQKRANVLSGVNWADQKRGGPFTRNFKMFSSTDFS